MSTALSVLSWITIHALLLTAGAAIVVALKPKRR
jgi:hypothetical protein